jgi:hypothetical protein
MKKIKFTTGEKILLGIYGLSLIGAITLVVTSEGTEMHHNINMSIWIASSIMWFFGFKLAESRSDRLIEAADKTPHEIGQKALSSAPSSLNIFEKGVYEEGFKDGVNYIKNEMNSVL